MGGAGATPAATDHAYLDRVAAGRVNVSGQRQVRCQGCTPHSGALQEAPPRRLVAGWLMSHAKLLMNGTGVRDSLRASRRQRDVFAVIAGVAAYARRVCPQSSLSFVTLDRMLT